MALNKSKSPISSLTFNIEDAIQFGQEESVILFHIRYWVRTNAANNKHNYDGRHWTYNSHRSLSELFPFWNEQKCKRLVQSLKEQGAILVGNYNKKGYDRTNWYTTTDDSSISQKLPMQESNVTDALVKNDRPIPITKYNYNIETSMKEDSMEENLFNGEEQSHINTKEIQINDIECEQKDLIENKSIPSTTTLFKQVKSPKPSMTSKYTPGDRDREGKLIPAPLSFYDNAFIVETGKPANPELFEKSRVETEDEMLERLAREVDEEMAAQNN